MRQSKQSPAVDKSGDNTALDSYSYANIEYKLKKRRGNVALYSDDSERSFEVVIIRTRSRDKIFPSGQVHKAGTEFLPCSSEWGKYGSTPFNRDAADSKFRELVQLQHGEADRAA